MSKENYFQQILKNYREVAQANRPVHSCPPGDVLVDYVYLDLPMEEVGKVEAHLLSCETCKMTTNQLKADLFLWSNMLEENPMEAFSSALGNNGQREIESIAGKTTTRERQSTFCFSIIKKNMIAWISPLWQPLYAGEAVTAAAIEEQNVNFEMDYGEYINLHCHWHSEKNGQSGIKLSWQANLLQASRLWARFIDPDSSKIITEILLGSELEGQMQIPGDTLPFNPTVDKWAIAIIVEEKSSDLQ